MKIAKAFGAIGQVGRRAEGNAQPAAAQDDSESGYTLVELIVSMGILAILIGIFMAAVTQEYKDTVRTQAVSTASDEALRTFDRFDHTIRYAAAVNRPVEVGTNWYLEYQTTATKNGVAPVCTQWKFDSTADTVAYRTWSETGATVTPTPFTVTSMHVINNPTTQQPFTFLPADGTFTNQRVQVTLMIQNVKGNGGTLSSTFTALNTSTATATNIDANNDGVSDTQVCQEAGRP
jgi:prepilin-type N-terminal cleavage/methylation domain-containing protein